MLASTYEGIIVIDPLTWNTDDIICKNARTFYVSALHGSGKWNQQIDAFFEKIRQVSTP